MRMRPRPPPPAPVAHVVLPEAHAARSAPFPASVSDGRLPAAVPPGAQSEALVQVAPAATEPSVELDPSASRDPPDPPVARRRADAPSATVGASRRIPPPPTSWPRPSPKSRTMSRITPALEAKRDTPTVGWRVGAQGSVREPPEHRAYPVEVLVDGGELGCRDEAACSRDP